ncbi:MAG: hypothetical protein KJZ73_05075 [Pseudorhodoplanes sp.]|nr:hypothetical protein [Pseudorhodoplanes sp.]MCL4710600.1 hypothetical protein [Pseudorhodoplanes sp.]GIK79261.1 MAG: hypothetical protein BroJett024_03660 [Alphaproteobacteria bacterium]
MLTAAIVAVAAFAGVATATNAHAAVRITSDMGGQIGPYLDRFAALRNSGQSVMIDGPCLSACTMLLGIIPRERICVTGRARLGFHAAWHPAGNGRRVLSHAGTQALWDIYPSPVRTWLTRRGGLKPKMVYLHGRELTAMYQACR